MRVPPIPPVQLATRVGVNDPEDPERSFDLLGRSSRNVILDLLPDGWSFAGKRVLDFGCGPGKVLRHFLHEAEEAELYGCDIDAPSIEWLHQNLSPPLRVFLNNDRPPLAFEGGCLDLVWAMSVFTHIVDGWSEWLIELRRVLSPGGLLIASFLGRGVCEQLTGQPWVEEDFGMNVFGYGRPWDDGGPTVFLSPWWIRAHWGRAFEIIELRDSGEGHGFVVLKKPPRGPSPSPRELEQTDAGEAREYRAIAQQVRQLQHEVVELRTALRSHAQSREERALDQRVHPVRRLARRLDRLRARLSRGAIDRSSAAF